MQCENGHQMEADQQFCTQCGGRPAQAEPAAADPGLASAPPSYPPPAPTAAPSAPEPSAFGQGTPTAPGSPPTPATAASTGPSAGQQVEAQAAKWAPIKAQLLAVALVVASLLLELSSFLSAVTFDSFGRNGAWKFRLQTLAGASITVGLMLVVAAYLATSAARENSQATDLAKKASMGVLIAGIIAALFLLLGLLGDLGTIGDDFGQAVAQALGHLGGLVLIAAAAGVALMAKPSQVIDN